MRAQTQTPPKHNKSLPWFLRLALKALENLAVGHLTLQTDYGTFEFGRKSSGPEAALKILDKRFFKLVIQKSDIGLVEAYMDGYFETESLAALIHLLCANQEALGKYYGGSWFKFFMYRLRHLRRKNTLFGSKKNIEQHYDLGNQFYREWLDRTMTYSSALFEPETISLEDAQIRKYQRVLSQLQVGPSAHVLEIGCGWGGFLKELVTFSDAKYTGITLSQEQYNYVSDFIKANDLTNRANVQLMDYRDLGGQYDAVVSIEMIEAVGQEYWPTYFGKIQSVLRPGQKAVIQAITIKDCFFEEYKRGTDFIQQAIFPGGMLLSPGVLQSIPHQMGLQLTNVQQFGQSYAKTLKLWAQRFNEKLEAIRAIGFDKRFERLWAFYLAYCEGAFLSERIDVGQYTYVKNSALSNP